MRQHSHAIICKIDCDERKKPISNVEVIQAFHFVYLLTY